jgi:hypothetical protein
MTVRLKACSALYSTFEHTFALLLIAMKVVSNYTTEEFMRSQCCHHVHM